MKKSQTSIITLLEKKLLLQLLLSMITICFMLIVSVLPVKAATPGSDMNKLRYGCNITWTASGAGNANAISLSDGTSPVGQDEFVNSIDVQAFVKSMVDGGFDYVTITDFHGAGTTIHPSAALDSWRGPGYTAQRDVLGEIISGLNAHGIKLFIFTHPLDGHDYSEAQQALLGWNDPTNGYKKWNDFINDVYADIVSRYGSGISGIGFDSDMAGKLDQARLRNTILSRQPNMWLGALAFPQGATLCDYKWKELMIHG